MNKFKGKTLSLNFDGAIFELRLHREPCNEIGLLTLNELELDKEGADWNVNIPLL